MKLHLPKLLRVAVLTVVCGMTTHYTQAATLSYTTDANGNKVYEIGGGDNTKNPKDNVVTHDGDLVLNSGDKLGHFDSSGNLIQYDNGDGCFVVKVTQRDKDTNAVVGTNMEYTGNMEFSNMLTVNGTLTLKGSAQLAIGGQYKVQTRTDKVDADGNVTTPGSASSYTDHYSALKADKVVVQGDGTVTNLQATAAIIGDLEVDGGKVSFHKDQYSGNGLWSALSANDPTSFKAVKIANSLTLKNNAVVEMGRTHSKHNNTTTSHIVNVFGSSDSAITITQDSGKFEALGYSYAKSGMTITQSGGTMTFRDYLQFTGTDTNTITQSGSASLSIGQIKGSGAVTFDITQSGSGSITLNYGASIGTKGTINITQTGSGTITLGGGNKQHTYSGVKNYPKTYAATGTYNISLTGSGTLHLYSRDGVTPAIKAEAVEVTGTSKLKLDAGTKLTTTELTLSSGSAVDNNGTIVIGTTDSTTTGALNVTTGGKLNVTLDGTQAAINVGAADTSTDTVTGWTMASGSTLGIGFTSDYLGTLTAIEKEGVKTYDFTSGGVLVATDTNDSVDVTSFGCTLTSLDDRYWKWSDDTALRKDTQGNIKLSGSLSFNPWVEVDGDNDHLDYVDDTAGGETGIIIKENVSLDGDNSHSLGTKIVGAEVELGHEDALGKSESVTTSGTSLLSTADGVTANLPSVITVTEGDLTIKGSYEAADGVLDEGFSQDAAYFCVEGNEGDNGFYRAATVEAHKVVDVMQGATLNVDALDNVLVTVDGKEYQLYDDGLAGAKLDYSEYHMNTEEHAVAAREILDAGTADTKVLMGADAGTLTADTAIEVDAEGGTVKTTAAAEVSGSLDDVAIVAEGGKISATIGEASSVLAQAGETTITGANSYTGDTVIDNATLVVGHADALGDSSIVLQNQGVFDMGGYAVSNDLLVTGCTIKGAGAYTGNMTIQNPTRLDDATTATSVKLEKAGGFTGPGSLTTGSLEVATDADASIEGSLTINDNGTVTLNDGKVLMVNGSLTLAGATTLALNGDYAVGDKLLTGNDSLEEGTITLVYNDSTVELERIGNSIVLVSKFKQDKADMAVQANWGIATASRAFVNAVRGQHSHTGCIANGRGTVWAAVLGAYNDMDGADISVQGAAVGVDAKLGRRSTVGISAGYTDGEVSPAGLRDVDQEGNYVALYGEHGLKKLNANSCLSLDWVASYGQTESKAAGLKWEQDSLQLNTRLNWNKKVTDRLCMSVFGGLEYFASGSDTSQGVKSGSIQNLRGEIGVGARYVAWGTPTVTDGKGGIVKTGCEKLVLNGELRYFNDMVRSNPVIEMDGLRGDGENPGRQGIGIEAGATYRIGERWSASANYSFNAMEDSTEHRVNVGASYAF